MNKLEELINKLCPDGVEYKKLKECSIMKRGTSATKNSLNVGTIPVISGGREPSFYCDKPNRKENVITVAGSGAGAGYVQYWDKPIFVNDAFSIIGNNEIDTKYLYYYLVKLQNEIYATKKGGGIPHVHISSIENFKIAIPPLEVQCEIVKILDEYTLYSAELSTLLLAELKARQKQYEYYFTKLINNYDNRFKLGDICIVSAGGTPSKTKSEYWKNGTIKWLGSSVCQNKKSVEEITSYITEEGLRKSSAKILKKGTTLIAMVGATIGKVAYLDFEATTNQNVAALYPKNENQLDKSYLYYACRNLYNWFLGYANGKFSMASLSMIKDLEISVPPLGEQEKIVLILDRFDKLCNDISEGLPAEIEARQKQYEYYRDRLLTFKELKVNK